MIKKTVNAQEVLDALHEGLSDADLMRRFELSTKGLQSLFQKLTTLNIISKKDLENRNYPGERTIDIELFRCPACNMPQFSKFETCPQCGVILSKFKKSSDAGRDQVSPRSLRSHKPLNYSSWLEQPQSNIPPEISFSLLEQSSQKTKPTSGDRSQILPGRKKWEFKANDRIVANVLMDVGRVYAPSWDGNLYCLDAESGNTIWQFSGDSPINVEPVLHNQSLLFGTLGGMFYSLDANDGSELWRFPGPSAIYAKAVVHHECVYFSTLNGKLFCLDVKNGEEQASYDVGSSLKTAPIIWGDKMYIGTFEGFLYCIEGAHQVSKS